MRYTSTSSPGLLARILGGVFALALGLVVVFLFTAFVAVAAGLALLGLGRLWWLQRKSDDGERDPGLIDAEYTVARDPEAAREPDAILPPRAGEG